MERQVKINNTHTKLTISPQKFLSILFTNKSIDHMSQDSKTTNLFYIAHCHIYTKIKNFHLHKKSKPVPKSYYGLVQEMRLILKL